MLWGAQHKKRQRSSTEGLESKLWEADDQLRRRRENTVAGGRGVRWEGKMCLGTFLRERLVRGDLNPFSLHSKTSVKYTVLTPVYAVAQSWTRLKQLSSSRSNYRCGINGFFQMNESIFILRPWTPKTLPTALCGLRMVSRHFSWTSEFPLGNVGQRKKVKLAFSSQLHGSVCWWGVFILMEKALSVLVVSRDPENPHKWIKKARCKTKGTDFFLNWSIVALQYWFLLYKEINQP